MEVIGENIKFDIQNTFQDINPDLIEGLTPVIINIIPITNFPLLLGEKKGESESLAKAS